MRKEIKPGKYPVKDGEIILPMKNEEYLKEEEKINIREIKENLTTTLNKVKKRLKDPAFWIDNILLIALIVLIIILALKGKYIDTKVIEVCNGMPTEPNIGSLAQLG